MKDWKKIVFPLAGLAIAYLAWRAYGLPGLAAAGGGIVMWLMLHFTRTMHVLKQAADRPIGHVGSAVMLNAKLKPGVNLLHVMAITRSLGDQQSPPDAQPEVFRWTDTGGSSVTCEFEGGRLVRWRLARPVTEEAAPAEPGAAAH
ncbi:MAG: glycerate kinase [Pseudomonadota bacterium]